MFHYESLGSVLVDSVLAQLSSGAWGAAVVGPRYGGKRPLLKSVAARLTSSGRDVLYTSLDDVGGQDRHPWAEFLKAKSDKRKTQPAVLLAADIDNLREGAWHHLLDLSRPLLKEQRLQVVLSGGATLMEWLRRDTELSDIETFVAQGTASAEFRSLGRTWFQREGFTLESPDRQMGLLFQWMGGSRPLLSWFLYLLIEFRLSGDLNTEKPLSEQQLREAFDKLVLRGVRWAPAFSRVSSEIRRHPVVWPDLERLLNTGAISGVDENGPPSPLELSGVATRSGNRISFASEAMETFAKNYFDYRRLGDFWGSQGEWKKAFNYFSRRTPLPPYYFARSEAKQTVAALCELLLYESGKSLQKVHDCFVDICRDYFVSQLWVVTWNGRNWELSSHHSDTEFRPEWLLWLPPGHQVAAGQAPVPVRFREDEEGTCIVVGDRRQGWLNAYIVDPDAPSERLAVRGVLFARIIATFARAHSKAIEHEDAKVRQRDSEIHRETLAELFRMIGGGSGAEELCKVAALRLRKCGYKRVLICLVDRERTCIAGVFDASPDTSVDIAAETRFSLDTPEADIQPYVVVNNEAEVIVDALSHRLVNKAVARRAGMRAIAVLPIPSVLNPDLALGTIHIERSDLGCPTAAELADLSAFALVFAGALQLAERALQWRALIDRLPQPVYYETFSLTAPILNGAAENLSENAGGAIPDEITEGLQLARAKQRNVRFTSDLGSLSPYPAMITSDRLRDSRGNDFGCFALVSDFSRIQRSLAVYSHLAAAMDFPAAISILFDEFRRQGFDSGRLYMITSDGDRLLLQNCFYSQREKQMEVLAGRDRINLPPRRQPEPNLTWRAINTGEPIILQYKPFSPHGTIWSHEGLPITICPELIDPEFFGRQVDSYAVEIPLLGTHGPFGKITLDGKPKSPEDFQLYRLLTAGCIELFAAFLEKDRKSLFVLREQAEQLLKETLHAINSRFAPIGGALGEYRDLEVDLPELKKPNDHIEYAMNSIATLTSRVAKSVGRIQLETRPLNLAELLQPMTNRKDCTIEIVAGRETPTVYGDPAYLEGVFAELINNSIEASQRGAKMEATTIRIRFECFFHPGTRQKWLRVLYSDNGPGIEKGEKERIFEPWTSLRTPPVSGRGLGLSYVRRVVNGHAGEIREDGAFGDGALFVIELPGEAGSVPEYALA